MARNRRPASARRRWAVALLLPVLLAHPAAAEVSVEVLKAERMFPGNTAFIDNSEASSRIVEIDPQGRTVWEYELPAQVAPRPKFASDLEWLSGVDRFLFTSAPNGVFEVDRQKNNVWSYRTDKISHDADRLPNGNTIFVYGRDGDDDAQVTEVSPAGEVVWRWHARQHLAGDTRHEMPAGRREPYSYTHANAVVRLPSGNTLVSLRNFHMLVEVDRSGAVVWKRAGLPRVHDPAPLPNGNLLVSLLVRPNYHPVREITRTGETVWEFSQSDVLAPTTVMPLPNGNVLIAGQNKIVEVTRDKEVVWRAVLRGVRPSNDDTERHIYKAVRIPAPAR